MNDDYLSHPSLQNHEYNTVVENRNKDRKYKYLIKTIQNNAAASR